MIDLLIENIYLTGSVDGLEIWSANDALLLSPEFYPIWTSMSRQYNYMDTSRLSDVNSQSP
jgi:hypothetical protein